MGASLNPENNPKQELNDSGCVQDAPVPDSYRGQAQLLDLSDDVLLYILKYCSPMDLKALGHTCPRLGTLICDHTLWQRVDARDTSTGVERLQWYLTHCLSSSTKELKLSGYVNIDTRCLGIQDLTEPFLSERSSTSPQADVEHFLLRMWYPHLPRYAMSPRWPDKREAAGKSYKLSGEDKAKLPLSPLSQLASQIVAGGPNTISNTNGPNSKHPERNSCDASTNTTPENLESDHNDPKKAQKIKMERMAAKCPGPQFTVNEKLLKLLRTKCENLTSLSLDYCNLDYKNTNPRYLPPKLKKLSLIGTRCYNLPLNMSFLGKIQDLLPELEYLDISECEWLEPASLMSLSKMPKLRELCMRDCVRLTECVAYASLATRYGFQKLKILDLRGSPVADSEVSAFGWLPLLEQLYLSPPCDLGANMDHSHKWDDKLAPFCELDQWEIEAPDYYNCKTPPPEQMEAEEEECEEEKKEGVPEERLGDVMVGNDISCASLERRIIVIHPNPQNNENLQDNNNIIPDVLGAHLQAPPENNEPTPGPSKRPHSDNVQESVKRPRLDKETSTTDDNINHNPEKKKKQETPTPGPSNLKTASAGPSDETPGTSKSSGSDSASGRDTKKNDNNQGGARNRNSTATEYNANIAASFGRHLAELLVNQSGFIQNIDPPNPDEIPIVPGPIYTRSNRSGQIIPLHNPAEARPDQQQRGGIREDGQIYEIPRPSYNLVTDSAVIRFGRAENQYVNYVHIGPGNNPHPTGNRPDRSNLRILSITGYNHITDRSLEHLATAAPHLRHIDFRYTAVTAAGVAYFKAIRPKCRVLFGRL